MPDSSMYYINRFLEFDPKDDNANYFLAYTYMMKNNPQKAVDICEEILKHNHKYAGAYKKLYTAIIDSYEKRGKKKEAQLYQEYLDQL